MDPDLKITVRCRTRQFQVNHKKVQHICATILKSVGLPQWQVAVDFVGPNSMRKLNREFRGKDSKTDVLSFPQINWLRPAQVGKKPAPQLPAHFPWQHLGDIAICPQVAASNAKKLAHGVDRETSFLLVHGILHLCGHDHIQAKEEKSMIIQQRKIMQILTPSNGTADWKKCIYRKRSA